MSSNVRSSDDFAVTSLNSVSSTASRSLSSATPVPVVVLIVRMRPPEALDGTRFVLMDVDEVVRAGHREHGLDAPLHAGELERAADRLHLAVEIHEAPDRRAVDVADRG